MTIFLSERLAKLEMVAEQLNKRMGAKVIAVSKDEWMEDFEADYMIKDYGTLHEMSCYLINLNTKSRCLK
jgi:hypothetical protein